MQPSSVMSGGVSHTFHLQRRHSVSALTMRKDFAAASLHGSPHHRVALRISHCRHAHV